MADDSEFYNLLDLITDKSIYHFKSDFNHDVNKWQDCVMNTSPPGAQIHNMTLPGEIGNKKREKQTFYDMNKLLGDDSSKKVGGIPFDSASATPEQEQMLKNLFETIAAQVPAHLSANNK